MTADDLSRPVLIDACAAGSLHIRDRGAPMVKGTLPVFSTATREEAESLRVFLCRLARDGSGLYFLNERPRSPDDATAVLRAAWERRRFSDAIAHRESETRSGRAGKESNAKR